MRQAQAQTQALSHLSEQERRFVESNRTLYRSHMRSVKVSTWYFGLVEWSGIVAIAIVVGVLGVAQTYLSNRVGQEVMHELRADVYEHLQRQSLAFFTRSRTSPRLEREAKMTTRITRLPTS